MNPLSMHRAPAAPKNVLFYYIRQLLTAVFRFGTIKYVTDRVKKEFADRQIDRRTNL